ncbi:MAG: RNHCP domain-containing protein [Patescibacteria group bacterium]|nr:RNHCP domain-containing protein [Patescibacteria group bacterium]
MAKSFIRTIEDFTCKHCKIIVKGDGYTNHCPDCLWSMHVDVNPGDRLHDCGGLMKPILLDKKGDIYVISHKCEICGFIRNNKIGNNDNFELAIAISNGSV